MRAVAFQDLGFGRLLESQISDFERGRTLPSIGSLLNFLAGCSRDGLKVDFAAFQRALEIAYEEREQTGSRAKNSQPRLYERDMPGEPARPSEPGRLYDPFESAKPFEPDRLYEPDVVSRIADLLSERCVGEIRNALQNQRNEMAELRARLVRNEHLITSILDQNSEAADPDHDKSSGPLF